MAVYGIHPEFISYLNRAREGHKVIWMANLRWLSCFGKGFSGDHDRLVFGAWNGMFELAFEFDVRGNWDNTKPVGIQFLCVDGQCYDSPELLTHCKKDGSLPALAIWKDALRYLKNGTQHTIMDRHGCALAARFLRKENIVVPKEEELARILEGIRYH